MLVQQCSPCAGPECCTHRGKDTERKLILINSWGRGKDKVLPQLSAWCLIEMQHAACGWGHVTCCVRCDETKCWLWRVTWRRDSAGIFTHDNILLRYNCYLAPACLVMNVMSRVTLNICFPCSPFHLAAPALTSQILLSWHPVFWKTGRYKDSVKYMKNLKQRQTDYEIITLKLSSWFIIIALLAWII